MDIDRGLSSGDDLVPEAFQHAAAPVRIAMRQGDELDVLIDEGGGNSVAKRIMSRNAFLAT